MSAKGCSLEIVDPFFSFLLFKMDPRFPMSAKGHSLEIVDPFFSFILFEMDP